MRSLVINFNSDVTMSMILFIKRWSEAESFTIFENHVYRSKKNLMFAINFEATPFLVGIFFLMLHHQKFAIKFEATPFLVGFFFPILHK